MDQYRNGFMVSLGDNDYRANTAAPIAELHARGCPLWLKVPILGAVPAAYRHEDALRVLRDTDTFANDPRSAGKSGRLGISWWIPKTIRVLSDNMLGRDAPDHKRLRRLVNHAFNRRGIVSMGPRIEAIAAELLSKHPAGTPFDLVTDFARPFPLRVISELLGIDVRRADEYEHLASTVMEMTNGPFSTLTALWNVSKLAKLMREELAACRAHPREGLLSELVKPDDEGEVLDEDEMLAMAFLLLFAGHETTVHLISLSAHHLITQGQTAAFANLDRRRAVQAVDELLRYLSPVEMTEARYARRDVTIAGHELRRGNVISAYLSGANRDPSMFENPHAADLARSENPHLGFGFGPHVCLGAQLARMEAITAFSALFDGTRQWTIETAGDDLNWNPSPGIRGFASLPVRWTPAERRVAA
ncbi:MAG: cytochrome P450 [Pseudomonadota bacterium]